MNKWSYMPHRSTRTSRRPARLGPSPVSGDKSQMTSRVRARVRPRLRFAEGRGVALSRSRAIAALAVQRAPVGGGGRCGVASARRAWRCHSCRRRAVGGGGYLAIVKSSTLRAISAALSVRCGTSRSAHARALLLRSVGAAARAVGSAPLSQLSRPPLDAPPEHPCGPPATEKCGRRPQLVHCRGGRPRRPAPSPITMRSTVAH